MRLNGRNMGGNNLNGCFNQFKCREKRVENLERKSRGEELTKSDNRKTKKETSPKWWRRF
jgi:hypothetical protein